MATYSYRIGPKTVPETIHSQTYEKEMIVEHPMAEIMLEGRVLIRLYSEHGEGITKDIAENLVNDLNSGKVRLGPLAYC